jgi:mitochondrial enoyl-[acyl-carrier protein] reductase / trans-2-enoyl-CoA reductase
MTTPHTAPRVLTSLLRRTTRRPSHLTRLSHPLPLDRRRQISSFGYTQAKALVYSTHGEPQDVLHLHNHSISPPTGNTVVIRMLTTPINPADVNQIQGVYPSKPEMTSLLGTTSPSAVGGNEGVGEVLSTGSSVKTLQKGDWVIMKYTNMGTWRTHMAVDETQLHKIDDKSDLSPLQVGTVSVNPTTAYRMLLDFHPPTFRGNEFFIQNGANSGVGRAAIQLGAHWGFKSINVIRSRPDKAAEQELKDELTSLGATHVITEDELQAREMRDRIKEWTNGGRDPINLGLNCVGGKPALALSKHLSPGGTLVTYGAMSKQPLALPASLLIFKDIRFAGFWVSRWSDKHPDLKKQTVEDILRLTREGRFRDVPVQECRWGWGTEEAKLREAVEGTLGGFRAGKGVFVFEEGE